ncbi:AEC family transporter [Alkalimarinus alittae]|uniref:AEC family transporter n=1 Tax=Alkalimarinus alittae TaxID=2961619 RepID=A0ABY6MY68_9ALTE|nr:AEC family transporter [Alkalimarinus alittae]UZE94727.1 AEC family transporter [Alkalimarinus alittae]
MSVSLALVPVFGLIVLGYLLRRMGFPGDSFWPQAEKFTYFLLFPAMLIYKLTNAERGGVELGDITIIVIMFLLTVSTLLVVMQLILKWPGAVFTSIYQGGIRFNSYVGLAAISELFGDAYLPSAAVAMAIMIPLINLLCILAFSIWGEREIKGLSGIFKAVATNPLIVACVVGITFNMLGVRFYAVIDGMIKPLSQLALPMGLMAVGAGLNLKALRGASTSFAVSSVIKLLVFPLVSLAILRLLGADEVTSTVVILLSCLPTASSSYILARQLGGDADLMATIVSGQTLLAIATIPLMVVWII